MRIIIYTKDEVLPTFIFNLAKHLRKKGHQVTVMGRPYPFSSFWEDGILYYPIPSVSDNPRLIGSVLTVFCQVLFKRPNQLKSIFNTLIEDYKANRFIKGRKVYLLHFVQLGACKILKADVIHNQWAQSIDSIAFLIRCYPLIQSFHGLAEDLKPFAYQELMKTYQSYFPHLKGVQSDSRVAYQNGKKFGLKTNNIFISYSLVEKKWLAKEKQFKPNNSLSEGPRIISIGRHVWKKGFNFSLLAMYQLKPLFNFHYKVIGQGNPIEALFHIQNLELGDYVSVVPHLSHDEAINEINKSDIFLLPSLQEGFATVVTEAMAVGTPVISTTCSGMPELLKHKENAWLVPMADPDAIADTILEVAETPFSEIQRITANARKLVEERLIWENEIYKYIDLYRNALS